MDRRFIGRLSIFSIGVLLGIVLLRLMPRPEPVDEDARTWQDDVVPEGHYPRVVVDDLGREVTIPRQPWRIISLAPSITEILYALEVEQRLIGRTDFCTYPPEAERIEPIGGMSEPNFEVILHRDPWMVIGTDLTERRIYDGLERFGTPALAYRQSSVEETLDSIRRIGTSIGAVQQAVALVQQLEQGLDEAVAPLEPVRAGPPVRFALLYSLTDLFAAADGAWPSQLAELCHAENVIIVLVSNTPADRLAFGRAKDAFMNDARWQNLPAVQSGRIVPVPAELLQIPGPRMVQATGELARALHPEAFLR